MEQKILRYLCIIIISVCTLDGYGQVKSDSLPNDRVRGIQYETGTHPISAEQIPVLRDFRFQWTLQVWQ